MSDSEARKLNLGCGYRYRDDPSWENADFPGCPPKVLRVDLRRPLPYGSARFDLVYMSHVLDHFPLNRIGDLLSEVRNCLRPGGVFRISVPDLERNSEKYLESVQANRDNPLKHQWHTIELLDQMTRTEPGGQKARFLRFARSQPDVQAWLRPMLGHEMRLHLDRVETNPTAKDRIKTAIKNAIRPSRRFDDSGERHFWTFDEISLGQMLRTANFSRVVRAAWNCSAFEPFLDDNLDAEDGSEYKPGSLYMEAVK